MHTCLRAHEPDHMHVLRRIWIMCWPFFLSPPTTKWRLMCFTANRSGKILKRNRFSSINKEGRPAMWWWCKKGFPASTAAARSSHQLYILLLFPKTTYGLNVVCVWTLYVSVVFSARQKKKRIAILWWRFRGLWFQLIQNPETILAKLIWASRPATLYSFSLFTVVFVGSLHITLADNREIQTWKILFTIS